MDRRFAIRSLAAAGLFATSAKAADAVPRVVYHLSDLDKVSFVLGNLRNHVDGMGGPSAVKLALVVHGPPLRAFRADTAGEDLKQAVARLAGENVDFFACIHTMEGMRLALRDLLPGFAVADKGGVVKLAQLQAQGWAYLRP